MSDAFVFPWARAYDADQLSAFIEDLWGATSGDNDLATLDAIEKVVAEHRPDDSATPCPLTRRQVEVLTEIAGGGTYSSAGQRLGITPHTVRNQCALICDLLRARNTMHAAVIAASYGWLTGLHIPPPFPKPQRKNPIEGAARHREHAAELREQPGTEMAVGDYTDRHTASTTARRIRKGLLAPYAPTDSFEARPARMNCGRWTIFARYVGSPNTTEATAP